MTGQGYAETMTYEIDKDTVISVDEFLRHYMRNLSLVIWNKLYRTSLVKEHLFAIGVTFEDDAWTPYVLSYAKHICYVNVHLYNMIEQSGIP